ncbi:hypothetical protein I4U23_016964 [Adineta vaga]|nr:hypothetical protein I4U23_016964 [Adineta vaga]
MLSCFFSIFVFFLAITDTLTKCDSNQCSQEMDVTSIRVLSTITSIDGIQTGDYSFIYAQLLKELLLRMEFDQQNSKNEFINFFKETTELNQNNDMVELDKFGREYDKHSIIWWYTRPGFIHHTINEALRIQDVLNLLRMGFLIQKLHRQLEHISRNSDEVTSTLTVYLGQGLTYVDYGNLKKTANNEYLSFNTFISVNTNYEQAVKNARQALRDGFETAVLFSIIVESSTSISVPFACIDDLSYFDNSEDEYIFSINTVFRIEQVEALKGKNSILHVKLRPISIRDKHLRQIMQATRKNIEGSTLMFEMAKLIMLMEQYSTAEILYNRLLNETLQTDIENIELIYHQLATIREKKNDTVGAIDLYERTLEIAKSHRQMNDSIFQLILLKIAGLLQAQKKFDAAMERFQEALRLELQTTAPNYRQRSKIYNDIGVLLNEQKRYDESLGYQEKSLAIDREYTPNDHMNLAITYYNMASSYKNMKNYEMALAYYQEAIIHFQQTKPMPITNILNNHLFIAHILKELDRSDEAVQHAKTAAKLLRQTMSDTDPNDQVFIDRLEQMIDSVE